MSKTIETLRRLPSKNDILHDHIVNTYFSGKSHKRKIKSTQNNLTINYRFAVAVVAVFLLFSILPFLQQRYLDVIKKRTAAAREVKIVTEGRLNKLIIKRITFHGYAKAKNGFSKKFMALGNARRYNWADVSLDFKFPIDFSNRNILISMKGNTGGERVGLVLRDANNKSSKLRDLYLVPGWRTDAVALDAIKNDIDISKITHVRLEYGYLGDSPKDSDSPIAMTIYLKDLLIVKEG